MDTSEYNLEQEQYIKYTIRNMITILEEKLDQLIKMNDLINKLNNIGRIKKNIRWTYYVIMKDIQEILDCYSNFKMYSKQDKFKYIENDDIIHPYYLKTCKNESKYIISIRDTTIYLDLRIKKYIENDKNKLGTNYYAKFILNDNIESLKSLIYNLKDLTI